MSISIPPNYRLRVKQRLRVVGYARVHGIKPASRHFGLCRPTVQEWIRRWKAGGEAGLLPRYPKQRKRRVSPATVELIRQARVEQHWGAPRTRLWLERVHGIRLNAHTIQRVFRDIGVPWLTKLPRRPPRQLKLFEKDEPGESVQVDVKVVKLPRETIYQYTALDDCTRLRVLRLYPRQNRHASLDFFRQVQAAMPFRIRKLQSDHGAEFPLAFVLALEAAGVRHRYIKPRRPQQNSAAIGLTTRSSGAVISFAISTTQKPPYPRGSTVTTTSGSRLPSLAGRLRRSSATCRRSRPNAPHWPNCCLSERARPFTHTEGRAERAVLA